MTRRAWLLLVLVACRRDATRGDPSSDPPAARARVALDGASASLSAQGAVTRAASFPTAQVLLSIEDIHLSTRLDEALHRSAGVVAVNGGFFDKAGEPIGLAISGGEVRSRFAPGLSGGVLWTRDGQAHLSSTEDYAETNVDFAVQCRPRLVVASRSNIRSDDGRRAARTAICLRDGGREIELAVAATGPGDGPTLFELAAELVAAGCEEALNLDGGPSTGWADTMGAAPYFRPPAAPVRHAIIVRRR